VSQGNILLGIINVSARFAPRASLLTLIQVTAALAAAGGGFGEGALIALASLLTSE
jgi:hypothetical protein